MGCLHGIENPNYSDYTKNDEEKHFRLWEQSLGCFRNNFTALFGLLISDERTIRNFPLVKANIIRNYSEKFVEVIQNGYFIKTSETGKIELDSKKLQNLIFLTTIHVEQKSGSTSFCDKASFLFNVINHNEEIEANAPIERNNDNLITLVQDFYDISAIVLASEYKKTQSNLKDEIYRKLSDPENKSAIIRRIIDELFKDKGGKDLDCLSFEEFNQKFYQNPNVNIFVNYLKLFIIHIFLFII